MRFDRVRPVLGTSALVLSGIFAGLLIAEALLALLLPDSNRRTTAGLNLFEPDPELGYRLQPEIRRRFRWLDREITILTDAQGHRVPAEARAAPRGASVLAVAGDSFVFGNEVLAEETFVEALGARLGLVPVNLGVGGYSLFQSSRALARFLRSAPADATPTAVLVIYVGNDIEWGAKTRPPRVDLNGYLISDPSSAPGLFSEIRVWLSLNSRIAFMTQRALAALAATRAARGESGADAEDPADRRPTDREPARWIYDPAAFTADRLASHRAILEELRMETDWTETNVTVVLLPEHDQVYGELSDLPNRRMADLLEQIGFPLIDLLPLMRQRAEHADSPLYHEVRYGHLSPEGHRVVAEILADLVPRTGQVRGRRLQPR